MHATSTDTNALLLQVMAHDLLAPLTAVKWQLELLAREGLNTQKRYEYMQQIQESAKLGITLTKHAHVAGRVLVGSYDPDLSTHVLSEVIKKTTEELRPQYERHAVKLDLDIGLDAVEREFDKELVGLFMWSLAKFFLSCMPANETVSIRGVAPTSDKESYIIFATATGMPECEDCIAVFNTQQARGTYDQAYVFAKLIRMVANLIDTDVSATTQDDAVIVEVVCKGAVKKAG